MKHFCRDFHLNIKISKPRVLDYTAPYEGTKPNFTTFTCHSAVANDCKFKIKFEKIFQKFSFFFREVKNPRSPGRFASEKRFDRSVTFVVV